MESLIAKAAVSLKGHDAGRVYMIVGETGEGFALCLDGKYRKKDNPKLKRMKHLKVVGEIKLRPDFTDRELQSKLKSFIGG